MATPPVPDDVLKATIETYNANERNQVRTAAALNCSRGKVQDHLRQAARRGMLLDHPAAMPGFRISRVNEGPNGKSVEQKPEHGGQFEMPAGHMVKGVSALVDADGNEVVKWIKTKQGELDPRQLTEWLKDAFKDFVPAAPVAPALTVPVESLLTLLPANDWHVNMASWGKQTGTNWDLKIAEPIIGNAVEDVTIRSPHSKIGVLLGGGDLMHVNGKRNETANGTPQDVDSRYEKGLGVLTRMMVRSVDVALRQHEHIIIRILKGNHDEDPSPAISYFLQAWYRNEPRVTVDLDPSYFWWHRFGLNMFGATHGDKVKIADMPSIMAHRRAEDWGATKFRYVHGFHVHHSSKVATEGNGVICETHQAPIPQDAWHFASGYLSGRSLQAITYHKEYGEIGRVRTAILDGDEAAAA